MDDAVRFDHGVHDERGASFALAVAAVAAVNYKGLADEAVADEFAAAATL